MDMDIVKKNALSIACGVIALIAIIAIFYPLSSQLETLQTDLQSRASVYQSLQSLRTKSRTLPVVNPQNPNPPPLDRFPNQQLIKEGQAIPAAFVQQAAEIEKAARKMNEHELLVPGSLPMPASETYAFRFRDDYRDMINNGIAKIMNAGHPPTPDEIAAAQQKLYNDVYKPQLVIVNGQARNQETVNAQFQADSAQVPKQQTELVAKTHMVYMDLTALTPSPAPTLSVTPQASGGGAAGVPTPTDMWYAQLGVWIDQDVAKAIARTNEGFKNVTQAPVKRLIKIGIDQRPYILPPTYAPGTPITGDPKAAVPKDFNASPTGRECNPMYDVVDFNLTVNVEADKIPWLLSELSDRQFITVLKADVKPVDSALDQTQGYIYGTKPVAQVNLVCEEIFLHDWCAPLMPKEVASNLAGTGAMGNGGGGGGPDLGPGMGPMGPGMAPMGPGGPPRY